VDKVGKPQIKIEDGRIPIVIGVTGHRDLRDEDLPKLSEQIHKILLEISQQYPFTPIILLTPLAEGADRLAAKVALDFGVKLLAPLPMPIDEYRRDFRTDISMAEFDELISKTEAYFVVPKMRTFAPASMGQDGDQRDEAYASAGAYVAGHSQILIALWDGNNNDLMGGTAQTIKFKLGGVPEQYETSNSVSDTVDRGLVYHIVTPRISHPNPAQEAFAIYKYSAAHPPASYQ
jgi:hypothetical protein